MYHGIINVYKEKGFTSHDVVAKMRGILKQKKIGHTGTLDPDATGVLPVCLGCGTKLCDMLTEKRKEYVAEVLLGTTTDTQDISGTVLQKKDVSVLEEQVKDVILSFVGKSQQIPPMYSAIKVDGKKLYELARQGIEIERKSREIEIYELEILETKLPEVKIRVLCSKGTYIRTLCHDIGAKLGCGACMKSLVRTKVSNFLIDEALTLKMIEEKVKDQTIEQAIVPVEAMFQTYKACIVEQKFQILIDNGNAFYLHQIEGETDFADKELVRVYNFDKNFYGIYEFIKMEQRFKPYKMFLEMKNK